MTITIIISVINAIMIFIMMIFYSAVEEKPSSAGSKSSKNKDKEADLVEVKSSGYSKK